MVSLFILTGRRHLSPLPQLSQHWLSGPALSRQFFRRNWNRNTCCVHVKSVAWYTFRILPYRVKSGSFQLVFFSSEVSSWKSPVRTKIWKGLFLLGDSQVDLPFLSSFLRSRSCVFSGGLPVPGQSEASSSFLGQAWPLTTWDWFHPWCGRVSLTTLVYTC